MNEKDIVSIHDRFTKRLLRYIPEDACTADEVRSIYLRFRPPNYLQKKLGLILSLEKVEKALDQLCKAGLVSRKQGTNTFFLNYAGKQYVSHKKKI